MKLFGSKDQDDNQPEMEEVHDDGFDAVEDATDDIEGGDGTAPVALSAPARSAGGGGGSKKGLLAVVGLVVVAGLGGGYYYLTNMAGDDMPMPVKTAQKATPAKAAVVPPQPTPAPSAATAAVTPAATATAPASTPAAAADPLALPSDAAMAVPATPVPSTPAAANAPAAPAAAGNAATTPAASVAGNAPVTAAPTETPPQDLPVPSAAMMAAGPDTSSGSTAAAPTWAQPGAEVPVTKDEAARKAANAVAGTKPSDAEMAIVQNAAVLDQLSQPAATPDAAAAKPDSTKADAASADKTAAVPAAKLDKSAMKTVDQLLQQDAVIRPLPNGYVTIIKNHDAGDLDSRLTRARVALNDNNNSAALELFGELNKDYPKDPRVLMGRAVALQKMGQVDEALAAYETVLNADPKNLEALTNMLGLLKTKDPQLALEKLKDLRAAYPYQPDITAQLGVAYAQAGDYDNALKYLNMAQALEPENAYVLYNQAVLYDKMGRSQKAGDLYRQIVRLAAEGSITDPLPIDQIKQRLIDLR